jgi:hypothetical protein
MFKCRTNKNKKVLITFNDINLGVVYLWDKQGKLINYDDQTELPTIYENVQVRLERHTFSERVDLTHKQDYDVQLITVDGQYLPGDVLSLEVTFDKYEKMTLSCKIIVGTD